MYSLAKRINRIDASEVRRSFDLASTIKNPKNLSIGQPDFAIPEPVQEAMIQAIRDNKTAYTQTQGILPLREALSEYYYSHQILIKPENIVVSAGVASVLFLLFEVLFNPNDNILLIDPYFLLYQSLANYHKLKIHYLSENFTKQHIQKFKQLFKFKNLKAIIFATPSNPTGKILDKKQLKMLAQLADEFGAILISDEIYAAYDYEHKFTHTASIYMENTLTLSGFSKSHAMTGLRVGYIAAPNQLSHIIEKIATLQQYSIVCSPQPAQWGGLQALKTPITNELNIMKRRRKIVLTSLKGKVSFTNPDGAFYIFPKIPITGKDFVTQAFKRDLLLVPGHIFTKDPYSIRLSYVQKEDILQEGLDIFCKLLEKYG